MLTAECETEYRLTRSHDILAEPLSGADILVRCLEEEKAEFVFGYPCGSAAPVCEALFSRDEIKYISARHEQGAAHMADGYARATGRPGLVLVTAGPGVANCITGIATAYMDSIPMVVLTIHTQNQKTGTDSFQEIDAIGISRPISKHSFLVAKVEDIPVILKKAFYIATAGRPGPVLVSIPGDVIRASCGFAFVYPKSTNLRSYNVPGRAEKKDVARAVAAILQSRRPIVYSGGGVVLDDASDELFRLVKKRNLPITTTLMGLGSYPATEPDFLGMLGMYGVYEANMAMHHSDLIIAVGARFDDRVTNNVAKFCPQAKIIHIDIDPTSISKIVGAHIAITGSVKLVLRQINDALDANAITLTSSLREWWQQIKGWRDRRCLAYSAAGSRIMPQAEIGRAHV